MKKKPKHISEDLSESYDYLGNSCSAWDCTGLIPFAPTDRSQLESYEDLYRFTPPDIPSGKDPSE